LEREPSKGPEPPRSWKDVGKSTWQGPGDPNVGKMMERAPSKGPERLERAPCKCPESPKSLERDWKEHPAKARKAPRRPQAVGKRLGRAPGKARKAPRI